jgi:hypothetical protein
MLCGYLVNENYNFTAYSINESQTKLERYE